jgi:hypothetical protein
VHEPPRETPAPPTGEELHLPGPSIIPLLNAVGLAVALVGLTVGLVLIIAGGALFLVTTVRWIRDTIHDVDQLPAEHRH